MSRERQLKVAFIGDASSVRRASADVNKALTDVEGGASKATAQMSTLDKVQQGAATVANKMRLASLGAGAALYFTANAASDLNETVAFTEVVFPRSSGEMRKWADGALESMGLARESALDAANGFGGLFKTTGSTEREAAKLSRTMTQLAVDMASAKNVDLVESMDALKSGLIGEAEPMRRFNVLLSEAEVKAFAYKNGIAAAGSELNEAQKVQARYGLILEQTKDFQGDYARTSDSAANAQRRAVEAAKDAAATLGEELAPILADIADSGARIAKWFASLPDPIKKTTIAIVGLVAIAGPMAKVVELGAGAFKALAAAQGLFTVSSAGGFVAMRGISVIAAEGVLKVTAFASGIATIAPYAAVAAAALLPTIAAVKAFNFHMEQQAASAEASGNLVNAWGEQLHKGMITVDEFRQKVENLAEAEGESAEERGAAYGAAAKVLHEYNDKLRDNIAVEGDVKKLTGEVNRAMIHFAGMTLKEIREWARGTTAGLNGVAGSLDDLADRSKLDADKVIKAFHRQLEAQRDWSRNFQTLIDRKAPAALLKQLQEMGLGGAQLVEALANSNATQWADIVRTWDTAASESRRTSKAIERSARETALQIKSAAQLKAAFKVFGADTMDGWALGILNNAPKVVNAAKGVAHDVETQTKSTLGIESPSKVFIEIGRQTVIGFAEGMLKEMHTLERSLEKQERTIDQHMSRLEDRIDRLRDRIKSFRDEIRGGFDDFGSIMGMTGDMEGLITPEAILQEIQRDRQSALELAQLLDKLKSMGLNNQSLQEIAAAGGEGIPTAQALIAGGPSLISQLNNTVAAVNNIANQTAQDLTPKDWVKHLGRLNDRMDRLQRQLRDVTRALRDLTRAIEREETRQQKVKDALTASSGAGIGGAGSKGQHSNIVATGKALQSMGFAVTGHPQFPPVGTHTQGSYHYSGRAIDVNAGAGQSPAEQAKLNRLAGWIRRHVSPVTELLYPGMGDPDHQDHLHLAMYAGGTITEPVFGFGMRSGRTYSFGERGHEKVIPLNGGGGSRPLVIVNVHGDVISDDFEKRVEDAVTRATYRWVS